MEVMGPRFYTRTRGYFVQNINIYVIPMPEIIIIDDHVIKVEMLSNEISC